MKIFAAKQIRNWDAYTIEHEPISSVDLMERAANACFRWLMEQLPDVNQFLIFCGTGNNGGDGLAIGRLLIQSGKQVEIYVLENNKPGNDFTTNLERLQHMEVKINVVNTAALPAIPTDAVIIDALFGDRPEQAIGRRRSPIGVPYQYATKQGHQH